MGAEAREAQPQSTLSVVRNTSAPVLVIICFDVLFPDFSKGSKGFLKLLKTMIRNVTCLKNTQNLFKFCTEHHDVTDALRQNEKRMYDVVDLLTQSSNQAAEDIASLKRQMTTIVGIAFFSI